MTPARGWVLIALFVITFNTLTRKGQTLSEQMDVWILKHPVLVRAGIAVVALHVANGIPARLDPIHRIFTLLGRKS